MTDFRFSRRLFLGAAVSALLPMRAAGEMPDPNRFVALDAPPQQIEAAIAAIDGIVAEVMARSGVPGIAVAVVHGGRTVKAGGYGLREIAAPDEITPDTVFQLASVSKSISATAIAARVGQGAVGWDSRMRELLPWFALSDPAVTARLTIGDLLSHRSGLPDHAGDDLEDIGFGRRRVLERLRLLPLSAFRDSYAYTNFGFTAAAEAVAAQAEMDWSELVAQEIFAPLGMSATSARYDDFMARADRAVPHARTEDGFAPLFQRQPDPQAPAGGVSASVSDMAKWLAMMLADGGDLIPAAALRPAISPQAVSVPAPTSDARAGFYGFGFNVSTESSGRKSLSHSGGFLMGAGTCFTLIPSLDLGIVVLSNAAPVGAVEAIAASFTDLAQLGRISRDWYAAYQGLVGPFFTPLGSTAGMAPPRASAAPPDAGWAVGSYQHPYFGSVEVRGGRDGLELVAGPAAMVLPLRPWDGRTMVFDFVTENAVEGSRSLAVFSGEGEVAEALEIELFGENGPSRFLRRAPG
ncbi:CubicO group peptidase, beta-lactamase class C family [Paracoccus isoporae]|uniref:CubicO group peptidase, beta-lactamase class C family n=1 Tax=Paracoccus isoporae TaxID=591205 RepID=A0A1G6U8V0_9RHOB|nr:serine hydrolase domain-containing protein [Paracoccus isoporae]SDD37017.1 CubicO group peptidase, beta-lactamase class C family [Paracoccus isoporae]